MNAAKRCLAVVWCLSSLVQAAETEPPVVRQASVAPGSAQGLTVRLAVDRLKTTLLAGDDLGRVATGWFCGGPQPLKAGEQFIKNYGVSEAMAITQALKKHGYPLATLGMANAFDADVASSPDFRIGGIVRELRSDICTLGNTAEGWIYTKIDWALFSEKDQKVVFQQTTEGLARSDKKVADLSWRGLQANLDNFISAPEFTRILKAASTGQAPGVAPVEPPPVQRAVDRRNAKGEVMIPNVGRAIPLKVTQQEVPARILVEPLKTSLQLGDDLGSAAAGSFCPGTRPLHVNDVFSRQYGVFAAGVATQALKRQGYVLATQAGANAFDTDVAAAPDLRLGGIVRDLRMEVCDWGAESEGWIYVKVDWALYSQSQKKVVFELQSEGLAKSDVRVRDLGTQAIGVSINNLLSSPEFVETVKAQSTRTAGAAPTPPTAANAGLPSSNPAGAQPAANRPSAGDIGSLQLNPAPSTPGGAAKNQARLRAAVVTLETAAGKGSGFYIDREGYLLTNFHVIQGAKFARVRMANGDKLVAQVVRISERDDVALLKSIPVDLDGLPVRPASLEVGEDVYAIGTPLGVLESTMTKGVLSADRVIQGVRVLQSDAAITFGSSGGPLLDTDGRVVGVARGGLPSEKGFNFFIPIQDALKALDLSFKPATK